MTINLTRLLTFALFVLISLIQLNLNAVPAYPGLVEFRQPDGTIIHIFLKGDEKINWAETTDGYTILVTKDGEYQYAIKDANDDLIFSGISVSPANNRTSEEIALLMNLDKDLRFTYKQKEMMLSLWEMKDEAVSKNFPTTGERTLLCILMQTPDVPFVRTQEEFDALFNQLNYTIGGASGSVKDYYLENSYGQFDLTVDVVGPYTANDNMSTYGSFTGARNLIIEGINLADPDVDYSDYDNSGDGMVEGVYMIFSGYGQEAGGGPNTIWSHAWSIFPPIQLDGVSINRYACSPERRGNSQSNPTGQITRIGVIGHEFGHVLNAPDYYDTDGEGSGGHYQGTGQWDMMAGGTWNNGGATPAHHNPYTKTYIYNWAPQNILDEPGNFTLENSVEDPESYYRINTLTPGEYFLLENRQKIGFDEYVPGEGLVIYHVHAGIGEAGNGVNASHPQLMYPISAGGTMYPNTSPGSYGAINSPATPFPGTTHTTSFTDFTIPGALAWQRSFTNKPVTNIEYDSALKTISFDFMVADFLTNWMHWDDGHSNGSVGRNGGGIFQIAARFTPEDISQFSSSEIAGIHVYVNNHALNASVKIWQGPSADSLINYLTLPFEQLSQQWNWVEFNEPFIINPELELWVGAEFDDPGANVFPAGRDQSTDFDGKGNLIRLDVNDPEGWTLLSEFNIGGDWSIRAMVLKNENETQFYDVVLHAFPPEGGIVTGFGTFPENTQNIITAKAADDFEFVNWTEDGIEISDSSEYSFLVEHDREIQANFQPLSPTFAENPDNAQFKVYPNPASEWLHIDVSISYEFSSVALYNTLGQQMMYYELNQGSESVKRINVADLPSGIYLLYFVGEKIKKYQKVILE
ncbi:MAG: M6 family metalloprotease domain-containing protein [Bacteroidales bacterium]|nr:M6 family metalloprotease domain-containing protein [Bacteroidales bacterium]